MEFLKDAPKSDNARVEQFLSEAIRKYNAVFEIVRYPTDSFPRRVIVAKETGALVRR